MPKRWNLKRTTKPFLSQEFASFTTFFFPVELDLATWISLSLSLPHSVCLCVYMWHRANSVAMVSEINMQQIKRESLEPKFRRMFLIQQTRCKLHVHIHTEHCTHSDTFTCMNAHRCRLSSNTHPLSNTAVRPKIKSESTHSVLSPQC